MKLGLTELQAKTYLTLTRLGKADVKGISKLSSIARQDIYRITPTLQKLGLVEEIIATPKLYKAIPLCEGTLKLFEKRTDEHSKLKSSLKLLIEKSEENNNATTRGVDSEFIIVHELKLLVDRLEKLLLEIQKCEIMLPEHGIDFFIFHFYESLLAALLKGAKIRIISKYTEILPVTARKLEKVLANPNFELKLVNSSFDFGMGIFDDKELNIAISDKVLPSLRTNNRQIIELSRLMFENVWNADECI